MKLQNASMITLAILLIATMSTAQNINVGLRAGAALYTVHNDDMTADAKYTTGLNFAIPVEIEFSPVFAIQPELHFVQKGMAIETKTETGSDLRTINKTNYLEVPVLFKGTVGTETIKVHAFAGPSIGYALNRYQMEEIDDADGEKMDVDFIDSGNIQDQRWDFGAVGGVGASMKAGPGSIVADARYTYGFTDSIKFENDRPDDLEKTTNRGFNFSLGYMISLNGK